MNSKEKAVLTETRVVVQDVAYYLHQMDSIFNASNFTDRGGHGKRCLALLKRVDKVIGDLQTLSITQSEEITPNSNDVGYPTPLEK